MSKRGKCPVKGRLKAGPGRFFPHGFTVEGKTVKADHRIVLTVDVTSQYDMLKREMIKSFKCKKTKRLFGGERVSDFSGFSRQAEKRLRILDASETLEDLRALRSNRFEALYGDRTGQYSIRINKQWRICFRWEGGACDVEIVDYH